LTKQYLYTQQMGIKEEEQLLQVCRGIFVISISGMCVYDIGMCACVDKIRIFQKTISDIK